MSKKTLLLGVLLATLFQGAKADVDPNFYVYICFGQSNMEGNAQPEAIDKQGIDERFQLLATCNFTSPKRTLGNWYKAIPPLVSPNGGLGPTDYFGRTMVANLPGVKIGVIPVAMGGSPIEMFDKDKYQQKLQQNPNEWWAQLAKNHYGGNPYGRIIEMAKKAQKVGVIKGILLHQGCSNCGDPNWPNMVKKIYNDMLTDLNLGADSVPIFVGEVEYQDQGGGCSSHNTVVAKIPSVIPTGHVISAKGIPGNGSDPWHFSAAGYRMFGRRYAISALTLMGVELPFFSFLEGDFEPNTNCTYDANTRTMTAKKSGGMVSWTYANGADWSKYKYLVVKLKEPQTANAEIIFFKTVSGSGHREDIGDRTTVVIDLKNLKNGSDASKVYKLAFRAKQAGKVAFDDVFLSNDEQYDEVVAIHDVNSNTFSAPLYSLDGRLTQPDALKPGIYIRSGKKMVIR